MSPMPNLAEHPDPPQEPHADVLHQTLKMLIISFVIAALYLGREIFVPLALAVLLSFVLDPLVSRLRRWHVPRIAAVSVVMVLPITLLIAITLFAGTQVIQLGKDLPSYQITIHNKLHNLSQALSHRGVFNDASRLLDAVETEFDTARRSLEPPGTRRPRAPMRVEVAEPASSSLETVGAAISPVIGPATIAGMAMIFALFILLQRNDLRDRFLRMAGGDLYRTTDALNEAATRVSRYLSMQVLINAGYGIPMAAGLYFIGVPGFLLWGFIAAVLKFVPYAGPFVAALFPLTMAFAVDPGWSMLIWTLILVTGLELISNNIIEPWLYGRSGGLAPMALLVSAGFWTLVWGPMGLILATPLTVCLVVMGRHLPHLEFLEVLLGRDPVFDAPTRLFQRLIAGNVEEAIELAHEQVRASALIDFYNDTAIPTLRIATNHGQGITSATHRHRFSSGMQTLVREMQELNAAENPVETPTVLSIGAKWETDSLAAEMLAQCLSIHGISIRHMPPTAITASNIAELDLSAIRVICLTSFNPTPDAHARYLCRRLRRLKPDLQIILLLLAMPTPVDIANIDVEGAEKLGADAVCRSLSAAVMRIIGTQAPTGDIQPQGGTTHRLSVDEKYAVHSTAIPEAQ